MTPSGLVAVVSWELADRAAADRARGIRLIRRATGLGGSRPRWSGATRIRGSIMNRLGRFGFDVRCEDAPDMRADLEQAM